LLRLLAAARRNLVDAARPENSSETRFDCAYKTIMQCALVAMMLSGYRPSTNAPGHHQTMIQSLPLTLGISNDDWIVLDSLRKKRNQNDCTGAAIAKGEVEEAVLRSRHLLARVEAALKKSRPDLLG
jgi:hypothetical protein